MTIDKSMKSTVSRDLWLQNGLASFDASPREAPQDEVDL
jgi:hypothetical protein